MSFLRFTRRNPTATPLPLTKSEIGWAQWAIDAMGDADEIEDFDYATADVPKIVSGALVFPTMSPDAIEDFLYRVEEQLVEMSERDYSETRDRSRRQVPAIRRFADKVRAHFSA